MCARLSILSLLFSLLPLFGGDEKVSELQLRGEYSVRDGKIFVSILNLNDKPLVVATSSYLFTCAVYLKSSPDDDEIRLRLPELNVPTPWIAATYTFLPEYRVRTAGPPPRVTGEFIIPDDYPLDISFSISRFEIMIFAKSVEQESKLADINDELVLTTLELTLAKHNAGKAEHDAAPQIRPR